MEDSKNIMKTGTTTLGIVCKDGIVLAADKRATAGNLIAQKDTQKIANITDNIAVTMAGTASDGQFLIRLARSELKIKAMRNDLNVSVREAANLMSRMVFNNIRRPSMIPGISHFVIAGSDEAGNFLYDIFPDGTISECKEFIASGSGSTMVYGILESSYTPDMSLDEGIDMALKCINASIKRDSASGNGIDIYTITSEGTKLVLHKEIDTTMTR
jgi:proteasome beta subunit